MKFLLSIVILPLRIIWWILGFVIGSVIRVLITIVVLGGLLYLGLGWYNYIDIPWLEPIRAGFGAGENPESLKPGTEI